MEVSMAQFTHHGKKRIRQRIGSKSPEHLIEEVLEQGIKQSEITGSFRRYLDKLSITHHNSIHYVHKGIVYCFSQTDKVLITCHQIPHNLMDSYLTYKKRKEND
jgi:hypothetical protein